MAIILARGETADDDVAPVDTHQGLQGHRIGVAHHPLAIDDDHAARKQVKHVSQSLSEPLLPRARGDAAPRLGELVPELSDMCLQKPLGLAQLSGKLENVRASLVRSTASVGSKDAMDGLVTKFTDSLAPVKDGRSSETSKVHARGVIR